jgi:hypothetical protein
VPDVNEQYTATNTDDVTGRADVEESPLSIPAVGRFAAAVSREVDEQLTNDVVDARLAEVRREALTRARSDRVGERGFAQELARYGYTLVRMWLQVILVEMQGAAAIGRQGVDLDEAGIHEMAKDTVARAIASFRDEQPAEPAADNRVDLNTEFLSVCVRSLPDAYRSRQLHLGQVGSEFEKDFGQPQAGLHLVRALRHCVTDRRGETAYLLRSWIDSDQERDEIIELTRRALDRAARLYPETSAEYMESVENADEVRRS